MALAERLSRYKDLAVFVAKYGRADFAAHATDYREEARSLVTLANQRRDFELIIVPMPVEDYTTARVLTMDYIEGTKITAVSPVSSARRSMAARWRISCSAPICSRSSSTACSTPTRIPATC